MKAPVEKNKEYEFYIEGMGFQGEGVGKVEGFTVFVPGAIRGEKVRAKILKVDKRFAFGKLIEIVEKSELRVKPKCGIYEKCGGCQIQHMSYPMQLQFKKQRVIDAVERIGKLNDVIIHDTLGMGNPFRYRNKVQLPVRDNHGKVEIGFYSERSHNVVDIKSCCIQSERADKIVEIFRAWMEKYNVSAYNEETGTGDIRHIMIREGFKTGDVMVVVVTNVDKVPFKEELVDKFKHDIKGMVSIIQNINNEKTNVILGSKNITLWGKPYIEDYIGEFKFKISPNSFFQVNPAQTEVLYSKALEYANLKGSENVFDAYCGTGTISLFLSKKAKKVTGVEIVEAAIKDAKENAKANGINNAEFIVGEAEKVIPELIKSGDYADVVVVDPPRKGCGQELLNSIGMMKPARVVYVSCDPGTLARDIGILTEKGYKVEEIQPVDMFPGTSHVECVVLMSRVED